MRSARLLEPQQGRSKLNGYSMQYMEELSMPDPGETIDNLSHDRNHAHLAANHSRVRRLAPVFASDDPPRSNVHKLVVKSSDGHLYLAIPLTAGAVAGGILTLGAPWLAIPAALAGLIADIRIEVTREAPPPAGAFTRTDSPAPCRGPKSGTDQGEMRERRTWAPLFILPAPITAPRSRRRRGDSCR
jgi:hypothetical protein